MRFNKCYTKRQDILLPLLMPSGSGCCHGLIIKNSYREVSQNLVSRSQSPSARRPEVYDAAERGLATRD